MEAPMASLSFISATKLADLLRSADPKKDMYAQVRDDRLVLGNDPLKPTNVIDFSKESIAPYAMSGVQPASRGSPNEAPRVNGAKFARRSGDYWFEIKGKRIECGSLKNLLAEALKSLERTKPGTLDNLSRIRGRSRRIVARDANQLFDKPHLVREYADKLLNGWYYGTNNSARETNVWLQRAAECAGLDWGRDFVSSLNPTTDDLLV
jgi:hypothetical protein